MPHEEAIRAHGVELPSYEVDDRYYTTCPKCSHTRKPHHQKLKVLHVTIEPEKFYGGCNHCGWTFPEPGFREKLGDVPWTGEREYRPKPNGGFHNYGADLRKHRHPFFWQHRNGLGEWEKGTGGQKIANLLYRLDEAQAAIAHNRPVLIVEGEKDVDTCYRLGFAATCNADGASSPEQKPKWKKGHSEQLRGAHLVVLNDNDPSGYAHADAVCKCSLGIAASVKRLDLKDDWPAIPVKGDISEWARSKGSPSELEALVRDAPLYVATQPESPKEKPKDLPPGPLKIEEFFGYSPEHNYIYRHTGQRWPAATINSRLAKVGRFKASTFIDRTQSVEQMTWMPGESELIKDKLVRQTGWVTHKGAQVYNLYRPPNLKLGNPSRAHRWIEHVQKIYPDDADYIMKWCAYRCQHPNIKINHALFLGGPPGIGKDTLLDPVRYTVGEWNCETVSPTQLVGRFNAFLRSVILVISEARDLGDLARPAFYEHTKLIMASPPDATMIDEKNTKPYYIPNLVGVVITSNHKAGGIFLPSDDRRHYVAWSTCTTDDFEDGYFNSLWQYFELGRDDIAAYLMALDVSEFDPKRPPPKTRAFWEIVNASRPAESSDMADTLDRLGRPDVVVLFDLVTHATTSEFEEWLKDRKNRRIIPDHLDRCGYVPVINEFDKHDGQWKIAGRRQTVYARAELPIVEQIRAVRRKQEAFPTQGDLSV